MRSRGDPAPLFLHVEGSQLSDHKAALQPLFKQFSSRVTSSEWEEAEGAEGGNDAEQAFRSFGIRRTCSAGWELKHLPGALLQSCAANLSSPNTGKIRFYDAQTSSLWEEKLIIAEHRGVFFIFWTSLW